MEKKFSELEEGAITSTWTKRSFAERLPEIVEKEADMPPIDVVIDTAKELEAFEGPRWIVFADYENGTTTAMIGGCESLEDALEEYRAALTTVYTVGISAVVKRSTDYDYVSSTEFHEAKVVPCWNTRISRSWTKNSLQVLS